MVDPLGTIERLEARYPAMALNWEAMLSAQYRCVVRQPHTIVDVGAHRGAHVAHFLAMGAERVEAFEPIPELCAHLVQQFGGNRLTVHQMALGDQKGPSTFLVDRASPGESGLRSRSDREGHRDYQQIQVDVGRLDQFELQHVDYIKLDTEGAELTVLAGAEATITVWRPLLSVEYGWAGYHSYGFEKGSLREWARSNDYVVCDLFGASLASAYDLCVNRYYWDYFLVPDDAPDLMRRLEENGRAMLAEIDRFRLG
jgi:FkbM family methyltransferase